jgi:hypothetical protein
MARKKPKAALLPPGDGDYDGLLSRVASLLEQGRRTVVRTTNAILAANACEIFPTPSGQLQARVKCQTPSGKSAGGKPQTLSAESGGKKLSAVSTILQTPSAKF